MTLGGGVRWWFITAIGTYLLILFPASGVLAQTPYTLTSLGIDFVVVNNHVRPQVNIELQRVNGNTTEHAITLSLNRVQPSNASIASHTFTWASTEATFSQSFTDTGVTTGVTVSYALQIAGTSPISQTTQPVRVPGPPAKPGNFRAGEAYFTTAENCATVDLSWDELSGSEAGFETITGYEIEAFSNGTHWWVVSPAESDANTTADLLPQGHHWRGVAPAHTGTVGEYQHCFRTLVITNFPNDLGLVDEFRYRIRARNRWTESPHNLPSPWSDELVVPGHNSAAIAEPPQNVTVALTPMDDYRVTWEKPRNANRVEAFIVAYDVYQRVEGADATKIGTVMAGESSTMELIVQRSTLMAGIGYAWHVIGVRAGMKPAKPSAILTAGTPTAPTVRAKDGVGAVQLEWEPGPDNGNGDNDVRWQVTYQSTAPGDEPRHALLRFGNRQTRGRLVDLVTAGTYQFEVRAVNRWGEGAIGRATATVTSPAALPVPTQTGTATVTVDDTTFTLTGPNAVQPGTVAVYTLNGGDYSNKLGVVAHGFSLTTLHLIEGLSLRPENCRFNFGVSLNRQGACLIHDNAAHLLQIASITPDGMVHDTIEIGRITDGVSQPFPDGAQLQLYFFDTPNWIGKQVAVGFWPEPAGQGTTVSWLGVTGTDTESRRIIVQIMPTESPRPPTAMELLVTGTGAHRIAWAAPGNTAAAGVDRYEVYRQTGNAAPILQESVAADRLWSEFAQPDPSSVYRYYVESVSFTGTRSTRSREVVAGLPNAPIDLKATGQHRAIALSWSEPEPVSEVVVVGYRLERSANGVDGWSTILESFVPTVTEYVDDQLRGGQTFHYQVFTRREGTVGPPSNRVSATTQGPPTGFTPTMPRNLSATATQPAVTLSWEPPADDGDLSITGYAISWSRDGETWQDVAADTRSIATDYVHGNLDYVATAHYQVAAINAAGVGYYTPTVVVTKAAYTLTPPTDLGVEPDYESLTLRWGAGESTGPTTVQGYRVEYYATATATWTLLAASTGGAAMPSFTDADTTHPLRPAQSRRYRIRTVTDNPEVMSDWVEITGRTLALPVDFDPHPGMGVDDALILYYALAMATQFNPNENPHAVMLRNTFLGPLVYPLGDTAARGFEPVFTQVQILIAHGGSTLGAINSIPGVDADDAKILYYASRFRNLLGNGRWGGLARFRAAMLANPSGLENPNDHDLQGVLRRAHTFLRNNQ